MKVRCLNCGCEFDYQDNAGICPDCGYPCGGY
jgi:hypothetical protein